MVGTVEATTSSSCMSLPTAWSLPWDLNAIALAISPTTRIAAAATRIFLRERVGDGLSNCSLVSSAAVWSSEGPRDPFGIAAATTVGPVGSAEANGMPRFAETSKPQDRQKRPSAISPHDGHPESAPHDRQNRFDSPSCQHRYRVLPAYRRTNAACH